MEPLRFHLNWLYITCWRRLADVKLKQELIYWLESVLWSTYLYLKVRLVKPTYDYTISHEHESCCSQITKHDCFYTTDTVNKHVLRVKIGLHFDIIYTDTYSRLPCLLFALTTKSVTNKATAKCYAHISNTVECRSWMKQRFWMNRFSWISDSMTHSLPVLFLNESALSAVSCTVGLCTNDWLNERCLHRLA